MWRYVATLESALYSVWGESVRCVFFVSLEVWKRKDVAGHLRVLPPRRHPGVELDNVLCSDRGVCNIAISTKQIKKYLSPAPTVLRAKRKVVCHQPWVSWSARVRLITIATHGVVKKENIELNLSLFFHDSMSVIWFIFPGITQWPLILGSVEKFNSLQKYCPWERRGACAGCVFLRNLRHFIQPLRFVA